MTKDEAIAITGGLSQTSKMPCKSFSTPTLACVTGYKLAQVPGTVCSKCYAQKGLYHAYANTIEPAQHARLDALLTAPAGVWEAAMAALMSNDPYFRWWDSGDVPSTRALLRVARVCDMTPDTQHWLPTREWGFVHHFLKERSVPVNLNIRMSANFPDTPVKIPINWLRIKGINTSNVHKDKPPVGDECPAPKQGNKCGPCRKCWDRTVPAVSYKEH